MPIGDTVQTILDSLDRSLFADITVSTDIAADAIVLCDRDKLTQALLNLVYNACEAMPHGGRLQIAAKRTMLARAAAADDKNAQVTITVEVTGKGIPKGIEHRVFEPLVSTKPRRDSGPRGLGLAIVYAAVTSSGGHV